MGFGNASLFSEQFLPKPSIHVTYIVCRESGEGGIPININGTTYLCVYVEFGGKGKKLDRHILLRRHINKLPQQLCNTNLIPVNKSRCLPE